MRDDIKYQNYGLKKSIFRYISGLKVSRCGEKSSVTDLESVNQSETRSKIPQKRMDRWFLCKHN